MQKTIKKKTNKLANLSNILSNISFRVGLLIIEGEASSKSKITKAKKILIDLGYEEFIDYIEVMDALASKKNKIFYIEKDKKLNGSILEIMAEFDAGIISLADRKNNTGLKTVNWDPSKVSFLIIMTRNQIEQSYPHLFEYINIFQSL